jgi:pimeloyl-ACP methyl ester carboxylesterase
LFAQKIKAFASNNGISGCGIIAHSQGGVAALHLYAYYWSCLDFTNSGSRKIQTVGTPYRGTVLAGLIAASGPQSDLMESGADAWLNKIPNWPRSVVYHWTTSVKNNWWSYDYCNLFLDPLLSDPDDGVIAKSRGQLSGGYNRGHKEGWW